MKRLAGAVMIVVSLAFAPVASAAPYISCPGGYIAQSGGDCPPYPRHPASVGPRGGGGGPHGGGLLGTIGRVLGGIGGLL